MKSAFFHSAVLLFSVSVFAGIASANCPPEAAVRPYRAMTFGQLSPGCWDGVTVPINNEYASGPAPTIVITQDTSGKYHIQVNGVAYNECDRGGPSLDPLGEPLDGQPRTAWIFDFARASGPGCSYSAVSAPSFYDFAQNYFQIAQYNPADTFPNEYMLASVYRVSAGPPYQILGYTRPLFDLVDPLSGLLNYSYQPGHGSPVVTDPSTLATQYARKIYGVSADGVTRAVLRGGANQPVTLTILNASGQPSQNQKEDGGFAQIGADSYSSSITLNPQNTSDPSNPMVFAIYEAPEDFARPTQPDDDSLAYRIVNVQVTFSDGTKSKYPIWIVRPPVMLVHGFTSGPEYWSTFTPLINSPLFFVAPVTYSLPVGGIQAIYPFDAVNAPAILSGNRVVNANTLGFEYNAKVVYPQFMQYLEAYRKTVPQVTDGYSRHIQVAAAQVDVVAHSMGALVTRIMPYVIQNLGPQQFNFYDHDNYMQGAVHKLITVGAPHLGSPLAIASLASSNLCNYAVISANDHVPLASVTINGQSFDGGDGDLRGSGQTTGCISPGLQVLQTPPKAPMHIALIAGEMGPASWLSLDTSDAGLGAAALRALGACKNDYAIQNYSVAGWPKLLGTDRSDAIVPLTSALDGVAESSPQATVIQGVIHGAGTKDLGFTPPHLLMGTPDVPIFSAPDRAIELLNASISSSAFGSLPVYGSLDTCK
jgi:pimeloyl-ACP methyl ester carboxylesterase